MAHTSEKKAVLYRMVMEEHICPFGLKAKDLLQRQGYEVEDHWLTSKEQVDIFKEKNHVKTTPQIFINGKRIGGYDDLRQHFGKTNNDPDEKNYYPVIVLFIITAFMAMATSYAFTGHIFTTRTPGWFISFSMVVLALLKLQNIEGFSMMFLNYDLLARRWVTYSYIYPFAEASAGILMIAGALNWISIPLALFIGTIGAISVFKAVYIDKRDLKCACVGGDSKVPLGFISLTENLMMIGMALSMSI
jgi:glutaredoxin